MTAAAHNMEDDERDARASGADIVTGEVMPEDRLIRFVAGPDGQVVPDVAAKLPGRGLWVTATRKPPSPRRWRRNFSPAPPRPMSRPPPIWPTAPKSALVARMLGDLGLARRSGALVLGFDNVLRALDSAKPARAADRGP